jgi:signal transduction histidine kinase/DNA-binding response OmpR family regulator
MSQFDEYYRYLRIIGGVLVLIFIVWILALAVRQAPDLPEKKMIEFVQTRTGVDASPEATPFFSNPNGVTPMSNWIEYLPDPEGELTFPDIMTDEYKDAFNTLPPGKDRLYFPYDKVKSVWVRFTVKDFVVEKPYLLWTQFDSLIMDYYFPGKSGEYEHITRSIDEGNREFFFEAENYVRFPLTYDDNQTFYIRMSIRPHRRVLLRLEVRTLASYINETTGRTTGDGIYLGFITMTLIYHLFLFFSLKEKLYLRYSLFLFTLLFIRLMTIRYIVWMLWLGDYWVRNATWVGIYNLAVIFGILFVRSALTPENITPVRRKLDRIVNGILIFVGLFTIPSAFLYFPHATQEIFTVIIGSLNLIIGMIYIIHGVTLKLPAAKYYLIGYTPLVLLGLVHMLYRPLFYQVQALLPSISLFAIMDMFQVGTYSFALGVRITILKKEKLAAQNRTIEEIRKNEMFLQQQNVVLEQRVQKRTRELLRAKEEAEAANSAKTHFLANISHELRTPLSGIIGFTELLVEAEGKERMDYRDKVLHESEQLIVLISDILDLSKIDSGKIKLECIGFSLKTFCPENLDGQRILAEEKGLSFDTRIGNVPDVYYGDPHRLRQVLLNLVSNAIKFTEKGGIVVSVDRSGKGANCLRFEVVDTGIGIPEEKQAGIFQNFMQADISTTRKYGGSGLGTSISKGLVEIMGGEIGVKSEPCSGTTFWFTLPIKTAAEIEKCLEKAEELPKPSKGSLVPGMNTGVILVVDDYPVNREVASHHLRRFGFRIVTAENGLEAVKVCKETSFDLILIDLQMPELDGYEAARRIRDGSGVNTDTPIIAVTAGSFQSERIKCVEKGMQDCLLKPFRRHTLLEMVERWIGFQVAEQTAGKNADYQVTDVDLNRVFDPEQYFNEIGDREKAFEILDGFIADSKKMIQEMMPALSRGGAEQLQRFAHTVKGGALNVYAGRILCRAMELEKEAKKGNIDAAQLGPLIEKFSNELETFTEVVNETASDT